MSQALNTQYRLHLMAARNYVLSHDRIAALIELRAALRIANGAGLKAHRSAVFRAINFVRVI